MKKIIKDLKLVTYLVLLMVLYIIALTFGFMAFEGKVDGWLTFIACVASAIGMVTHDIVFNKLNK